MKSILGRFVKTFKRRNKNEMTSAQAICWAVRQSGKSVAVKSGRPQGGSLPSQVATAETPPQEKGFQASRLSCGQGFKPEFVSG